MHQEHTHSSDLSSALNKVSSVNKDLNNLNNQITQGKTKYDLALSSISQIKEESMSLFGVDKLDQLKLLFNEELEKLRDKLFNYQSLISTTIQSLSLSGYQYNIDPSITSVDINTLHLEDLSEYESALVRTINDLNSFISNVQGHAEANKQQLEALLQESLSTYGTDDIDTLESLLKSKKDDINNQIKEAERLMSVIMHEINSHE
jgi:hypothetical protein